MDAEKLYQNVKGIDFIIDGNANVAATQGAEGEPVQTVGERFAYIGALVIDKEGNINDHYLISTDKLDSDAALQEITDRIKERLGSSVDIASGDEIAKIIEEYAEEADDSSDAAVSEDKSADNNSKAENTVSNEDSGDKDSEANADAEIKDNSDIVSADENNSDAAAVKEVSETDVETTDTEGSEDAALSVGSDGKYEVVKGDCLWKIAEKHLGDGSRWGEIYELNSDIISNPSLIYVGQQLVLPPG
ncbi:MAG: LysM peptidoglycan-binding domain-containing protein [Lachnospiraceae bacterium]|nr:LysM peptidoglycan-binding domain-containing protein [Lachnospiraceae bacterium]